MRGPHPGDQNDSTDAGDPFIQPLEPDRTGVRAWRSGSRAQGPKRAPPRPCVVGLKPAHADKISAGQIGAGQIGAGQASAGPVGPPEVGAAKIGIHQIRIGKPGTFQVGAGKSRLKKKRIGEIGAGQVRAEEYGGFGACVGKTAPLATTSQKRTPLKSTAEKSAPLISARRNSPSHSDVAAKLAPLRRAFAKSACGSTARATSSSTPPSAPERRCPAKMTPSRFVPVKSRPTSPERPETRAFAALALASPWAQNHRPDNSGGACR